MMLVGNVLNFARKLGLEQGAAEFGDRWDQARPALVKGAEKLIDEIFSGHSEAQNDAHQILRHLTPVVDSSLRRLSGGRPTLAERGRTKRHLLTALSSANQLRRRASLSEAQTNWQTVESRGRVRPLLSSIRREAWDAAITNFKPPTTTSTGTTSPAPVPVP